MILPFNFHFHCSANVKFRDDGVFMFDSKSLAYLVEEQEQASLLVSFCKKGMSI